MKIVVLVDPNLNCADVRGALRGAGLMEITTTTTWDELMQSVVETRPELVVIAYHMLVAEGEAALKAADWALRPLKIPVVIALQRDEADQRYMIEMTTEFEYFTVEPFEIDSMRDIVIDAVGQSRWRRATQDVSVVDAISMDVSDVPAFGASIGAAAPPVSDVTVGPAVDDVTPFGPGIADDGEPDDVSSVRVDDPRMAASSEPAGSVDDAASHPRGATDRPRVSVTTPLVGSTFGIAPPEASDMPSTASETRAVVRVPDFLAGELGEWRVPHVLAALADQRLTGILRLTRERVRREIAIFDGRPGARDARSTMMDRSRLLSTFAWASGTWVFVADEDVSRTSFMPYAGGFEFIWEGIGRNLSMNAAAAMLTPHLKSYAVHTDRLQLLKAHGDLGRVRDLLERFVGDEPFERQMMHVGASPDDVLRAAWFGEVIGAVVFFDAPTPPPVTVELDVVPSGESGLHPSVDASSGSAYAPSAPPSSMPSVDPDVTAALTELGSLWDAMSTQGAFELFGIDDPADESMLTERYYSMVREYHPDRYARVNDPQVRALSEQIFLHIRSQYARARAGETGPRRPSSAAEVPATPMADARSTSPQFEPTAPEPSASAPSPGSGSSTSAPGLGRGVPGRASSGRRRPVSQVLEDLRRRRTTGSSPMVESLDSGSFRQAPERQRSGPTGSRAGRRSTGSQMLSPEQLLRNAVKALESGAIDKAYDHLARGRTRGGEGKIYDGAEEYIGYLKEERTASHVARRLKDLSEDAERHWEKSLLLLFKGHVHRLEEDDDEALKAYRRASQLDEANLSAQRWERHAKMRLSKPAKKKETSLLDKLRNTKITLGKSK